MKYTVITICLFYSFSLYSQPWLYNEYRNSGKEINEISIEEQISAFDNYWVNRQVEKGKGFMPFSRWKEFTEIRVSGHSRLPSDIYFSEWLKDKQNKSSIGNWQYIGADETPLEISSGERSGSGRVNAVEFDPTNTNIIYIGAPAGGLWKSTNGGATWQTTTDQLASIGVSDIAIHPQDNNIIYIATGDADASDTYTFGLLKSVDAGLTWQTTGYNPLIEANSLISKVIINPLYPDSILIATNTSIRLSTNGAGTFTLVKSGNFRDIKYKPGDPSVVYATTYSYSGGADVLRSVNGGKNWTFISPPSEEMDSVSRISIGISSANPEVIYLLAADAETNGFYALYRSSDGGNTWELKYHHSQKNLLGWEADGSDTGGQGWYDLTCTVSPLDANVVIVGGVNLWRSNTGGNTFNIIGHWWGDWADYVHADQHIVRYQPQTGGLFVGNDGGFYRTYNDGNSWTDLSDGLHIMQVYRMNVASHGSDMIICGTQDNGTMLKTDWLWNNVMGGDGMDCMIDYLDIGVLYGEYYYGSLFRTYNGGYSWDYIKPLQAQSGSWVTPLAMHPSNPNTIYAGYEDVYKSDNQGNTWSNISVNLLDSELIKILAIAPSDADIILAGNRNKLMRTNDNGASWTNIYSSDFVSKLSSVCISPENPDKIWATISGYVATRKVYYSEDGGINWISISDGLPNVPVNCLVYELQSPDRIYAGTDIGVYVKDTVLSAWIPFKNGLPNTVVNELEISNNEIIAATYGRGIWKSDLLTEYPQNIDLKPSGLVCRVYPNPASDYITVSIPEKGTGYYSISVCSPDGKIIYNSNFNDLNYRLDISGLSNGIYILSVSGDKGNYVSKLQIVK